MERSMAALFFAFLLFSSALAGPQTQRLIDQLCQRIKEYDFCNTTLNQHIPAGQEMDMQGLARIALEQGLENDTNTQIFAKQLAREVSDKDLLNYILNCIDGYMEILAPFQDGLEALGEKNYSALVADLKQAPEAYGTKCLVYTGGVPNPLDERNREMRILLIMSLNAAYILNQGAI